MYYLNTKGSRNVYESDKIKSFNILLFIACVKFRQEQIVPKIIRHNKNYIRCVVKHLRYQDSLRNIQFHIFVHNTYFLTAFSYFSLIIA